MEIKAAVVSETSGDFNIEQLDLSEPNDDEVLVRIVGVGICHTDLAARDMHLPIPPPPSVFGHEGAGVVEEVGTRVTKVKPGDHVVLAWDYCGACTACKAGKELYCLNFFLHNFHGARPDGTTTLRKGDQIIHGSFFCQSSFADFALANERNVVKVREDLPLEVLAPMGCGVMTGAGAVMNSLQPRPGASIAVFGAGNVGLSAVLAAVVCGCTTIIAVRGGKGDDRRGCRFQPGMCRQSQGPAAGCGCSTPPWRLWAAGSRATGHRGCTGHGPSHERPDGQGDPRRRCHPGFVYPQAD